MTADTTPAGESRQTTALQLVRRAFIAPAVGPLIALILTMLFFSLKSDRFLQAQNLSLVLQQVMVVGVLAIGQTLVILTAGIDLSVGTVMAFGQIVMTKLAVLRRAWPTASPTAGASPATRRAATGAPPSTPRSRSARGAPRIASTASEDP